MSPRNHVHQRKFRDGRDVVLRAIVETDAREIGKAFERLSVPPEDRT